MSRYFSSGGTADKRGYWYEEEIVILHLLRLLTGEATEVRWENRGDGDGVDVVVRETAGEIGIQAKHRSEGTWTLKSLKRITSKSGQHSIITYAGGWLSNHEARRYRLATDQPANAETNGILQAARNEAPATWARNAADRRDWFTAWGRDPTRPEDQTLLQGWLQRFEVSVCDQVTMEQRVQELAHPLAGDNTQALIDTLRRMARERLGQPIAGKELRAALHQASIPLLPVSGDTNVAQRLHDLAREFHDDTRDRRQLNAAIPRRETDAVMTALQEIPAGGTIVVHGPAGAGKSEVLAAVIDHLMQAGTPVLALALDRLPPTADPWSDLHLGDEPLKTLVRFAADRRAVAVLDQLDAATWAGGSALPLLSPVRALLRQARSLHVTVIAGCRTVDLNAQIAKWLTGPDQQAPDRPIAVDDLDAQVVEQTLVRHGIAPGDLDPAMLGLARRPLWLRFIRILAVTADGRRALLRVHSLNDLMMAYDGWLHRELDQRGIAAQAGRLLDDLADYLHGQGRLTMPLSHLNASLHVAADHLVSLYALSKVTIGGRPHLRPTHQTLIDHRLASTWHRLIRDGGDLLRHIGAKETQDLGTANRLRLLVPLLLESPEQLPVLDTLIRGDALRPLVRLGIYHALAAIEDPSELDRVGPLVRSWLDLPTRRSRVIHQLVYGNVPWVAWLSERDWIDGAWDRNECRDDLMRILSSVAERWNDGVARHLERWMRQDPTVLDQADAILFREPGQDGDALFEVRLEGVKRQPLRRIHGLDWSALLESHPIRAARLLAVILPHCDSQQPDLDRSLMLPRNTDAPWTRAVHHCGRLFAAHLWPWWMGLPEPRLPIYLHEIHPPWLQATQVLAVALAGSLDAGPLSWSELLVSLPTECRWIDRLLLVQIGAHLTTDRVAIDAVRWFIGDRQAWIVRPGANASCWAAASAFLTRLAPRIDDATLADLQSALCDGDEPWRREDDWPETSRKPGISACHLLPCLPRLSSSAAAYLAGLQERYGDLDPVELGERTMRAGWVGSDIENDLAEAMGTQEWLDALREAAAHPDTGIPRRVMADGSLGRRNAQNRTRQLTHLIKRTPRRYLELAQRCDATIPATSREGILDAIARTEGEGALADAEVVALATLPAYLDEPGCQGTVAEIVRTHPKAPWPDALVDRLFTWVDHGGDPYPPGDAEGASRQSDLVFPPLIAVRALAELASSRPTMQERLWQRITAWADEHTHPAWRITLGHAALGCREGNERAVDDAMLSWAQDTAVASDRHLAHWLWWLAIRSEIDATRREQAVARLWMLLTADDPQQRHSGGFHAVVLVWRGAVSDRRLDEVLGTPDHPGAAAEVRQGMATALADGLRHAPDPLPPWVARIVLRLADDTDADTAKQIAWSFRAHQDPSEGEAAGADRLLANRDFATAFIHSRAMVLEPTGFLDACDRHASLIPITDYIAQAVHRLCTRPSMGWAMPDQHLIGLVSRLYEEAVRTTSFAAKVTALDAWDQLIEGRGNPEAAQKVIVAIAQ